MRLAILSDLHMDHYARIGALSDTLCRLRPEEADVLVVAGDIASQTSWLSLEDAFRRLCSYYKTTVYVPGNHDYYSIKKPQSLMSEIANLKIPGLKVLMPGIIFKYENYRFLGGTGWYDDCEDQYLKMSWSDYSYIKNHNYIYSQSRRFKNFLRNELKEGDIVVSHMLPSYKCVNERYVGDDCNVFFVNDVENIVLHKKPILYIHGHTHYPIDTMLGNTRVFCNPLGYPGEKANSEAFQRLEIDLP